MRAITLIIFITLNLFQPGCNKKSAPKTNDVSFLDTAPNLYADKVADSLKYLIPILDTVLRTDQRYRTEALYMANITEQNRLDSINTKTVTGILDRYGWLGMKDIGYLGYTAINMVMTHSKLQYKLKYQPMMLQATLNKKVIPDARRARLKMGTMSQYLNGFKTNWDAQEYKAKLPELVQYRNSSEANTVHNDLSTILKSN